MCSTTVLEILNGTEGQAILHGLNGFFILYTTPQVSSKSANQENF